MQKTLRILQAQINLTVGDIDGNRTRIVRLTQETARTHLSDLIIFPELALTGYPPEDLLYRPELHQHVQQALSDICHHSRSIALIVGHPTWQAGHCYNSVSVIYNQRILLTYHKQRLPNTGVFDELRYFTAGKVPGVFNLLGARIGLLICEDAWSPDVALMTKQAGADILCVVNASPYALERFKIRQQVICERARDTQLPVISTYLVGGQDALIFDGGSFVSDASGVITQHAPLLAESNTLVTLRKHHNTVWQPQSLPLPSLPTGIAQLYQALVLAVRDYVQKSGFHSVLVGLSGGIDSAVTLAIAVDALGAKQVEAVLMPSVYTADISNDDAKQQAHTQGVNYHTLPIAKLFDAAQTTLAPLFNPLTPDLTEENLQARCRGMLLMALSNKFGHLVLSTSNKSEVAVGYSTLYGDMVGAFAVLQDVYKTQVYALARYRNSVSPAIPERVITRPPSAELRPEQTDQDSLPPYDILDAILRLHLEDNLMTTEITAQGFDTATVTRVLQLVKRAEYKRFQAPPGPKVSTRAFGKDWRLPIASSMTDRR